MSQASAVFDSKLEDVERRYLEIESKLSDPALAERPEEFRRLSQEHAGLGELVATYRQYRSVKNQIIENRSLLDDPKEDREMAELAREDLKALEPELESLTKQLQRLLLPPDPNDGKNILLEVRAGAGGDEAGLFAAELFRLYMKFAERQGWRVEIMSTNATGIGGLKEGVAMITGQKVYSRLKYEGGVHRVQRVPATEAQGRVHTSTVTVAILPEAEEVELHINPTDLRIDVFRSGGAGGQGVNTTDSAVRITHLPTNTVVVCQDERSQHKNRDKAMKILRARILEVEREKAAKAHADARRSMVGTGDRSERIRTYNFPQGRLTDHRIGLTLYQLGDVMDGHIEELVTALQNFYQLEELKAQGWAT